MLLVVVFVLLCCACLCVYVVRPRRLHPQAPARRGRLRLLGQRPDAPRDVGGGLGLAKLFLKTIMIIIRVNITI